MTLLVARVVAGGDSLLDADLLAAADAAVRPAHGELHATGWDRAHVTVTARSGVLGGQDVAAWYLAQAWARPGPGVHDRPR